MSQPKVEETLHNTVDKRNGNFFSFFVSTFVIVAHLTALGPAICSDLNAR